MAQNTSEHQESTELPRIPIPRTRVNKGMKKGWSLSSKDPSPLRTHAVIAAVLYAPTLG
jgi:hypothetical protein